MKTKLFSEFDPVSAKAYKQKIQFDLKGDDYNETLVWQSLEGIHVKPFYHRDDVKVASQLNAPSKWLIGERIFIVDPKRSAQSANEAVANGVEAIYFQADSPFDSVSLFENLSSNEVPLFFDFSFLDEAFYKEMYQYTSSYKITVKLDIINHLTVDGNWYFNLKEDHQILKNVLNSGTRNITIDSKIYQNAGATMVQQIAYSLGQLTEYLNFLDDDSSFDKVTFEVAVGSNYFFEIAKFRALRQLTEILLSEFKKETVQVHIIAHPTLRNKTIYDYNSNMLRTTTECMSAVLGGADWVVNMPYDYLYHKTNDFGQRISRNQLIILKEESYFEAVQNPCDGAYYIEEVTAQLAQKSLDLLKDIERNGGLLSQLKKGTVQRKIKESAAREQSHFDNKEITLIGTNKYPNQEDRMKDNLQLYPFVKINPRKTLIEPIIPHRLAESLEKERLKTES